MLPLTNTAFDPSGMHARSGARSLRSGDPPRHVVGSPELNAGPRLSWSGRVTARNLGVIPKTSLRVVGIRWQHRWLNQGMAGSVAGPGSPAGNPIASQDTLTAALSRPVHAIRSNRRRLYRFFLTLALVASTPAGPFIHPRRLTNVC